MQVWEAWGSPNLHILKKDQHFDAKRAKTCINSKKSKILIVKSHQTCIYSKKSKKSKISDSMWDWLHRWISFWFFWFFWVYAGLVTFHYQIFCFFWVYAGFVHFWHQHVDLFWVYAGLVNLKSQTYIFATFEWHDFFQSMFLFQYLSIKIFRTKIQIRIVLISSLIFDNIFIVIQNIDNIILLRMLISWI